MTDQRTARVQGLRQSGAAGAHVRRPTRADELADALAGEAWLDARCPACPRTIRVFAPDAVDRVLCHCGVSVNVGER